MAKFLSVSTQDGIKAALTAAIATVLASATKMLNDRVIYTTYDEWKPIIMVGLLAFIGAITRRFFTNSDGQTFKKERDVN